MDPADSGTVLSSGLSSAAGELQIKTSDRRIEILGSLDSIVFSLLILGLAFMSRQFLVDVIDGAPFTFANARLLRWIGWFLLGIGVVIPVVLNVTARRVLSIVKVQSPTLSPPIIFDATLTVVALFVLILSVAFRYGVELEKERSLTI